MAAAGPVTVLPVVGIPEVAAGDDLGELVAAGLDRSGLQLLPGDIVVVSSKVASKALGLVASSEDRAAVVAGQTVRVVAERVSDGQVTRIVESAAGPVMAAAGVDASNVGGRGGVLLLPHDPDAVCRGLRESLTGRTGVAPVGVILSDTAGRPWRVGQTDFALGAAGVGVVDDLRGGLDADGRGLMVTARAVADEIAAAADLVKGKVSRVPVALVRGLAAQVSVEDGPGARSLVRTGAGDWFALGSHEAVRAALGVTPGTPRAVEVGLRPTAGNDHDAAVRRAVTAARLPLGDLAADVEVTGTGPLVVTGPDAVAVGMVAARLCVALAGEGLPTLLSVRAGSVEVVWS